MDAFARTDILQVLFFSVLFGVALSALGDKGRPVAEGIDRLSQVLFRIVGIIMHVAPIGAFGAMAFTIGSFGVRTLAQLGALIACFWLTCVLFVAIVLGLVARLSGFSLWRFVRYIREELFVAFGTSSSETVLPRLMARLEAAGVERSTVGLVVPAGYSFNLDGTAIYLSMATLFIAQATNTTLSLAEQVTLLAILLLTSKGAAGVAGAALVVLAGTLAATSQIPVAGVAHRARHPPLHGRGHGRDQHDRQRRGGARDRAVERQARRRGSFVGRGFRRPPSAGRPAEAGPTTAPAGVAPGTGARAPDARAPARAGTTSRASSHAAQPPAAVGPRRVRELVVAEVAAREDRVDEREAGGRPIAHRHGCRAIELDDGRRIGAQQHVVAGRRSAPSPCRRRWRRRRARRRWPPAAA